MSALRALRNPRLLSSTSAPSARLFSTTRPASFAKMQVIGRLASEPELTNTGTGREIVRYTVATSYGPRDDPKTSWFRVVCFEPASPRRDYLLSLPKGALLHVDADAQMQSYEDSDGKKRSSLNLIHRNIEVLARPRPYNPDEAEPAAAEASG